MNLRSACRLLLALALLAAPAWAETLTGVVRNGTLGRPSAGDDVILLELSQGMNEVARTKSDAQGRFSLELPNPSASHLVRVSHQNVNYFRPAPPGATSVEVEVYDAASRVAGVSAVVDILRLEADASSLQVVEVLGMKNDSKPPRTWMGERTVELVLPRGAQVQSSLAAGPGGMPVNSSLVPLDDKGRHAFVFPIRPGETRFQISYTLPYSGEASLQPRLIYPVEHLVVILPKSMQLEPAAAQAFQQVSEEEGSMVHVATNVQPGQEPGFRVRGVGQL
ncbi:MAG: carboxypeptidase regulatory-like domain-containing protein, partial [Terriglobales bacterium]